MRCLVLLLLPLAMAVAQDVRSLSSAPTVPQDVECYPEEACRAFQASQVQAQSAPFDLGNRGSFSASQKCGRTRCRSTEICKKSECDTCVPKTCEDIRCAAGELCSETPDGPDCVPEPGSCEGFFCRRGTNCYIRGGKPVCLPNTCAVRQCSEGLYCLDTACCGALCRRGKDTRKCSSTVFCPPRTFCRDREGGGIECAHDGLPEELQGLNVFIQLKKK